MTIKIAFLGDICLSGRFDLKKNPDACKRFYDIKSILDNYDYVIGNLESPLTERVSSKVCKAIHLKSPPVNVEILQYLGLSAVSLANNHIFDYGKAGYEDTLGAMLGSGVEYFGTDNREIMIEKHEERILLGGYCCLSAHPSKAGGAGVNILNYKNLRSFFENAKNQEAFPIASVHWGDENVDHPRSDHILLARMMSSKYDFLLHGHHPHVVQDVDMYRGSLIAYSLGNFCTDEHVSWSVKNLRVIQGDKNKESFILGVTLKNNRIVSYETIPFFDGRERMIIEKIYDNKDINRKLNQAKSSILHSYTFERHSCRNEGDSDVMYSRYSLSWLSSRLNYYFIGAVLKAFGNKIRYYLYFRKIRNIAKHLGVQVGS